MSESAYFAEWQHRIAVSDDPDAFLQLYRYFKHRLEKFAYSICHSKEDAKDIVEDVFVRIWIRRRSIDHIQNLKLYLYIATRNFSLNYCRNRQRATHLEIDALKVDFQELAIDPMPSILGAEQVRILNEAIQQLPNKCRIIFKLIKEDGLRYKEVAELLHLSPKTIENQLAIAVKRLATALGRSDTASLSKKDGASSAP